MIIIYYIESILLNISAISLIFIAVYILKKQQKSQLHYIFMLNVVLLLIWTISFIIETSLYNKNDTIYTFFSHLKFTCICLTPVSFIYLSIIFTKSTFKKNYILYTIIPLISIILIWTNNYHHIFFKKYSFYTYEYIRGWYFYVHGIYSYLLIFKGIFNLLIYSFKNKGLFSKQAILITLAVIGSFVPNLLNFFSLSNINIDITSITFTFFSIILFISIFKFDFLNIIPIALRTIVDNFTDSFIVVNNDLIVLEYNKTFIEKTSNFYKIEKSKKIKYFLQDKKTSKNKDIITLKNNILKTMSTNNKLIYESVLKNENSEKYFSIEIIPLFHKIHCIGTLVFFKNITTPKKKINSLEEKNSKLDNLNMKLKKQCQYIETINQNLKELSEIDELTGAYNRRFFNHYYEIETLRSKNQLDYNTSINNITNFGIAIIDIDNFKNINDIHGHLTGDVILQQLVKKIKNVLFLKDILCRYGGEEFVIIFTKTTPEGVITAADKIRKTISEATFFDVDKNKKFKITISIGVASFDELITKKTNSILKLADDRLLKAKSSGKNRVVYKNNYKD